MAVTLITGASGLIGKALTQSLAPHHDVVCMSRNNPGLKVPYVRGSFAHFEDLVQLDRYDIGAVVHLASEIGGCLERNGMLTNVEGTRCLMRYLIDRGCKKFVMASSIATVGFQSTQFRPAVLPIPDEHPCLDRDGYGFSKYMMEEVTKYYHRQNEAIDVINLRLATIYPDERMPAPVRVGPLGPWCLGGLTIMSLGDAVRVFTLALESTYKPGVRLLNAAGPRAWAADPTAEILRGWWGDDVDLSHFERRGHEFDSVFDVSAVENELGFVATDLPPSQGR